MVDTRLLNIAIKHSEWNTVAYLMLQLYAGYVEGYIDSYRDLYNSYVKELPYEAITLLNKELKRVGFK